MHAARTSVVLLGLVVVASVAGAQTRLTTPKEDQTLLRAIYQELVEINTTDSVGDTTKAAQAMAARLRAAGYADQDLQILYPAGAPKKGNLIARLHGTGAQRPLLLLAHLDVVEARREDWTRDPFKLVEENGFFYGRGAVDDKAMASVFVEEMVRFKREGYRPNRDIILALTADEELGGNSEVNGVEFLLRAHKDLVDADLALNEPGGGHLGDNGKYEQLNVQVSEKIYQDYRLQITNPGGHSSVPKPDNAIYAMSAALAKVAAYTFPAHLNEVTRAFFERTARSRSGQLADDMRAILANPPDAAALTRLSALPDMNAQLRTTCVATMIDGGHAKNALPQRVTANVNCRILPDEKPQEVEQALARAIGNPDVKIAPVGRITVSQGAPLKDDIMKAVESVSGQMWPGVPVIPVMSAGGTDGRFLNNAGIRTYGVGGMFINVADANAHGLNEKLRVAALYEGQEFLYRVTKALALTGR
jgi:acetylornithine deacetylase/succinyl-diaminopimelate desuccinylase-like protein